MPTEQSSRMNGSNPTSTNGINSVNGMNGVNGTNGIKGQHDERKYLYLAGVGVTHSIAPPMHNHIAHTLGKPWTFHNKECPTIADVMSTFRAPTFAGGVVTMPYKKAIMPHLDGLDPLATTLGACNNVYLTAAALQRGTTPDWPGIRGCLVDASPDGCGQPALGIGAGGASRAAVYALSARLACPTIYVLNRDAHEVAELLHDAQAYGSRPPRLVHVRSREQACALPMPFYIVGTVPDLEPHTPDEHEARAILETFLAMQGDKGVLLDMCFKPRETRILKLARRHGWRTVEGTEVIGHQIEEQWRLWAGDEAGGKVPKEEAWRILRKAAKESPAINF